MKFKQYKRGFTIVEVLISLSLTIVMTGVITSFLMGFNKTSIQNNKRVELSSEMQILSQRLQKEIESAAAVLTTYSPPSYYGTGTISSNSTRIILSKPVYDKTTYMPASTNARDTANSDVIIIDYVPASTSSISYGKLYYSLIPASATASNSSMSKSPRIIRSVLNKSIINSENDSNYTPISIFKYYTRKGVIISGNNDKYDCSLVEANLYGRKEYQNFKVRQNLVTKISLRSYAE